MRDRLPAWLRRSWDVVKATIEGGERHDLSLFAPAIAYALVISLAPLTIVLNLLGAESVRPGMVGAGISDVTGEALYGTALSWAGRWSSVLVLVLVVFGASTLFVQLVRAIGRIWSQGPGPGGLWPFVRKHLLGFLLFAAAAVGLFASAIVGNAVSAATQLLDSEVALDISWLAAVANSRVVLDIVFSSILLAVAFTTVPRIRPRLKDVLPGVLVTSVAYAAGQWGLSLYLGSSARFTTLGAFGALLAFLVWAYYTAAIILWGAEFTHEIARRRACRRGGSDAAAYDCSDLGSVESESDIAAT